MVNELEQDLLCCCLGRHEQVKAGSEREGIQDFLTLGGIINANG